jgi:hypothetical protein
VALTLVPWPSGAEAPSPHGIELREAQAFR